ncbi:MAG: SDR family NAD(P)-dependent oxidoreductase, partial [Chloroflexi bacterium]
MSQLVRFTGKVVIVTGAASGIGQATLVRLVSEGAIAVGVDVNEAGLAATIALAQEQASAGGRASYMFGSVSHEADVKRIVQDVVHQE